MRRHHRRGRLNRVALAMQAEGEAKQENQTAKGTVATTDTEKVSKTDKAMGWKVVLWNDDVNSFSYVEQTLQRIIHCNLDQAMKYSSAVHKEGKVIVYQGHRERCEAIALSLMASGLSSTISQ